jgi:hypothetical protein
MKALMHGRRNRPVNRISTANGEALPNRAELQQIGNK